MPAASGVGGAAIQETAFRISDPRPVGEVAYLDAREGIGAGEDDMLLVGNAGFRRGCAFKQDDERFAHDSGGFHDASFDRDRVGESEWASIVREELVADREKHAVLESAVSGFGAEAQAHLIVVGTPVEC
jgi:hypothetical protein